MHFELLPEFSVQQLVVQMVSFWTRGQNKHLLYEGHLESS